MLYIVATPIGNLEDISLRALRILKEVDLIACEDTRTTQKLLARYSISTPTISYFQHSRLRKVRFIVDQLREGKNIALVSESGTPCISDPGIKLINLVIEQFSPEGKPSVSYGAGNLAIVPIPGPSALIAAASVSGFPVDKFVFMGFPPHKKGRKKYFQEMVSSKYTVIFYESPYRILKSLRDLRESFKKFNFNTSVEVKLQQTAQKVVVCRELTKKFETIYRGTIEEVIEKIEKDKVKGEFTVILQNKRRH